MEISLCAVIEPVRRQSKRLGYRMRSIKNRCGIASVECKRVNVLRGVAGTVKQDECGAANDYQRSRFCRDWQLAGERLEGVDNPFPG